MPIGVAHRARKAIERHATTCRYIELDWKVIETKLKGNDTVAKDAPGHPSHIKIKRIH